MTDQTTSSDDDHRRRRSHEFKRAIEAIVLVAHDPVAARAAGPAARAADGVDRALVRRAGRRVREPSGRGFELVRVAGGYRYQTHADLTPYVERFLLHDQRARLSGRGARDAGDRRLQAADLAGPGRRRSAASTPTA